MYVIYKGSNAKARRAAAEIARVAGERGILTIISPVEDVEAERIEEANAVVVGCSVKVDTPFGGQTSAETETWLDPLPELHGKPVGIYCTYSFFPHTFADVATRTAEVLSGLERHLEDKGAKVVVTQGILNRDMGRGAALLVDNLQTRLGL